MSFKPAMMVNGTYAYNALRFAESWEADKSARDLYQRWTVPTGYAVHESDDPVSHVMLGDTYKDSSGLYWSTYRTEESQMSGEAILAARNEYRAQCVVAAIVAATPLMERVCEIRETEAELARDPSPSFVEPILIVAPVASLPAHVVSALRTCGYSSTFQTVRVEVCHDTIQVNAIANDGCRAFVSTAIVLDATGHARFPMEYGPFGGPNAFQKSSIEANPIRKIPSGGAIVTGTTSNRARKSPYVTLHLRAVDAATWLLPVDSAERMALHDAIETGPSKRREAWQIAYDALGAMVASKRAAAAVDLTDTERLILVAYRVYKGGSYRLAELRRIMDDGDRAPIVEGLAKRGLLKIARNGASQITDAGRAAVAG